MVEWKRIIWWASLLIPVAVAIPFLFNVVTLVPGKKASECLGVVIITACWWILEPIPIVITAFFPVFLLPLFGVCKAKDVAAAMFSDTSMIFLGGFIFSIAMVKWNLHSRIALKTVCIFGLRPKILLLGICLVTAILSMCVSNTATALTMVPNAMAIITKIEEITGDVDGVAPFAKALFLGIAFSASIGGMATTIGTPPNLIFVQTAANVFPNAPPVGFAEFMFVALPTAVVLLIIMYGFFVLVYMRKVKLPDDLDSSAFEENYKKLGKWQPAEIIVGLLFILLAFLWLFRADLSFGDNATLIGWSSRLHGRGNSFIQDGTVALCLSMLLFLIHVPAPTEKKEREMENNDVDLELRKRGPNVHKRFRSPLDLSSSYDDYSLDDQNNDQEERSLDKGGQKGKKEWVPILDWEYTQSKIPWTILFLFSGGFALNQGFADSTLDSWLGEKLKGVVDLPLFVILLAICFITSILSNIASNTACASILLPVVAVVAKNAGKYHPWMLMIPCAFSTTCCFVMPVATPPNLICFGSGRLTTRDFMIAGGVINVLCIFAVIGMCIALIPPVFDAHSFPKWANSTVPTI